MHIGVDGLSLHVQESLDKPARDGSAYAFHNKSSTRIKLLIWDGTCAWLCVRRLHKARFVWPPNHDATCVLSNEEWQWLITGIDWTRLNAALQPDCRV